MTCIVGYVEKGKVWMGADSAAIGGLDFTPEADDKIFKVGKFIIGYTGYMRMGQILRYHTTPDEQYTSQTDHEYLCTTFIDHIRTNFKNKGHIEIENNMEKGGFFLLGYKGQLYEVQADFHVGKIKRGYEALGCGADYAKGCLYNIEGKKMTPKEKIIKALEAATEFSVGVSNPFYVINDGGN